MQTNSILSLFSARSAEATAVVTTAQVQPIELSFGDLEHVAGGTMGPAGTWGEAVKEGPAGTW